MQPSGVTNPAGLHNWHLPTPVLSQPVHRTATYRFYDTRCCIIQFCPPDDEHMFSKHVEAWNKLIIKFSASSCLILINKYIEMYGQQNIKKYIYFLASFLHNNILLCNNEAVNYFLFYFNKHNGMAFTKIILASEARSITQ